MAPVPDSTTLMPCGWLAGVTNTRLLLSMVRGPAQGWLGCTNPGRLAKRREEAVGPTLGVRGALARRLDSTILATLPGISDVGLLTRAPVAAVAVSTVGAVTVVDRCTPPVLAALTKDWRVGPMVVVVVTTGADRDGVVVVVVGVVSAAAGTSTRLSPICTTKNCLGTVPPLWVAEAVPDVMGAEGTTTVPLGRADSNTELILLFAVAVVDVELGRRCPALNKELEMAWVREARVASLRDGERVVVVAALASKGGMMILEVPLLVAPKGGIVITWGRAAAPLAGREGMVMKRGAVVVVVWPDDDRT